MIETPRIGNSQRLFKYGDLAAIGGETSDGN